jgi:O-antigen/teichoic acid export membrane protein
MGSGWLALTLLARPLCALLLGPAYREGAAELLPWIAAAYGLQCLQQTFEIMLYAHGATRRLAGLQALAAATSVLLYLLLVPRYGARGAACGTFATFAVTTAAAFFLAGAPARLRGVSASC